MNNPLRITVHKGKQPYTEVGLSYEGHCVAKCGPTLEAALQQLSFDLLNMATLVTRRLREEKENL